MSKRSKQSVQNQIKKIIQHKIRQYGGYGVILLFTVLLVIGFFNPDLRDRIAAKLENSFPTAGSARNNQPLTSKKQSPLKEGIWTVVHVVDGDTLDVVDDNGAKYRIRLIGADTPETVKPNTPVQPFGHEASNFTKLVITQSGNRVRVAFDGDQVDQYGRNLAMIYLQTPQGEIWLNELLIREGLAKALLQYRFSKEAKKRLQTAENEAKKARRKIWSTSTPKWSWF
ncbi:MAG: thermonuclease family protein [Planctomycetaceae bacterium]|jgi:micrococcal nuclease|nr:thermonuclease family protein [Planctomycetaceae bacterium]